MYLQHCWLLCPDPATCHSSFLLPSCCLPNFAASDHFHHHIQHPLPAPSPLTWNSSALTMTRSPTVLVPAAMPEQVRAIAAAKLVEKIKF
jgi:hypothetical protein